MMPDAADRVRPYRAEVSVLRPAERPSTLPELLRTRAAAAPDAACLLSVAGASLTWCQLLDQLDRTRAALRAFDIGPEDRVAVVMPNGPVLGAAFLALASAAACAPLNPSYSAEEFAFYLGDLKAKALVVADEPAAAALAAAEQLGIRVIEVEAEPAVAGLFTFSAVSGASDPGDLPRPDSVALLLHTSGTTSRPKLVPLRHSNLVASAFNMVRTLELTTSDRCLDLMPLFHIHGLIGGLLAPLAAGGSTVCPPGFRPNVFFPWFEATAPTWYTAVPTMHRVIAAEAAGRDLRDCRLRFLRSSSAPLPMSLFEELEGTFGVPVVEAYSMTEAAHQMTCNPLAPGRQKPGTVGVPAGPEVGLLQASGRILQAGAVGEIGEIVIRGPSVIDGYEANPAANADAFVSGWFRTGDQGQFDEDGYLVLTGRIKEQINRGGEKISPLEIDQAMLRHPDIAEAVAFGFPHSTLGEEVAAAVVLRPGARTTPADLHKFLREKLAPFKLPKRIITLDQIPKGPTGKIQRRLLSKQLMDQPGLSEVAETVEVAEGPEADLLALWRTILERPDLGLDDDFFESGGDSLRALQILFEIELLAGRKLPESILLDHPTVRDLARSLSVSEHSQIGRIVRLQTDGTRAPLFFFTGDQNGGYYTHRLARLLGPDQPFVSVAPHDLATAPPTIESMAADGLPLLLELNPHGSFRLAGYCNGGMMALETARLLLEAGRRVDFVALIDTPALNFQPAARALFHLLPTKASAPPACAADPWYAKTTDIAWRQLNNVLQFGYACDVAKGVMRRLGPRLSLSRADRIDRIDRPGLRDEIVARDILQSRFYNRVLRRYLPPRIDAPVVYYSATYPRAVLRGLGPNADFVRVPGGHWGCITSHAEALAADLRARLGLSPAA